MSSAHLLPIRCTLLSGMNNNVQKCTDSFSLLNYTSFMAFSITQSKGNIEIAAHYYYRHVFRYLWRILSSYAILLNLKDRPVCRHVSFAPWETQSTLSYYLMGIWVTFDVRFNSSGSGWSSFNRWNQLCRVSSAWILKYTFRKCSNHSLQLLVINLKVLTEGKLRMTLPLCLHPVWDIGMV